MGTTSRLALPFPEDTDAVDVPGDVEALADALDGAAIIDRGSLASRPVSTAGTPGIIGRLYVVSDQGNRFDLDYGTGWVSIGEIPDDSITAAMLAAALKPSGSADPGDEALRAIGSGAGNVVAGNDARLTDDREPLDDSVTGDKLADALAAAIGVSSGGVNRRGKSIIPDEEVRTNTAYGKLATPDEVTVTIGDDEDLIVIGYDALWQSSVANAGRAAIFIGANQFKIGGTTVPVVQEIATEGTALQRALTEGAGLAVGGIGTSNVATGQVLGRGVCYVEGLPAGTYVISIQFKSASGSVTVKERKLFVWTEGF